MRVHWQLARGHQAHGNGPRESILSHIGAKLDDRVSLHEGETTGAAHSLSRAKKLGTGPAQNDHSRWMNDK